MITKTKKIFCVVFCVLCIGGGVFALELKPEFSMSAGAGGMLFFGERTTSYILSDGIDIKDVKFTRPGGGLLAFLDATYAEFLLGFHAGAEDGFVGGFSEYGSMDHSFSYITIGAIAKYPIGLGKRVTVFPMLGMMYFLGLSFEYTTRNDYSGVDTGYGFGADYSEFYILPGAGLDFNTSEKTYLRFEILYGVRTGKTKYEEDKVYDSADLHSWSGKITDSSASGVMIKLLFGYKFYGKVKSKEEFIGG